MWDKRIGGEFEQTTNRHLIPNIPDDNIRNRDYRYRDEQNSTTGAKRKKGRRKKATERRTQKAASEGKKAPLLVSEKSKNELKLVRRRGRGASSYPVFN